MDKALRKIIKDYAKANDMDPFPEKNTGRAMADFIMGLDGGETISFEGRKKNIIKTVVIKLGDHYIRYKCKNLVNIVIPKLYNNSFAFI